MSTHYRDLAKHSGVYALGLILQRSASLILLPIYTRYLPPEQYGALALLDSLLSALDIIVSRGIILAMGRMHSAAHDQQQQDRVWWTAFGLLALAATLVTAVAFMLRHELALAVLGSGVADGPFAVTLVLATLWFNSVELLLESHLRILKCSTWVVALSAARLVINAALNLTLLIQFHLGMFALLTGNLVTAILLMAAFLITFVRIRGAVRVSSDAARAIWSYGSPLIVTTMLAFLMHQADRFLLRLFVPLSAVGVYSVAYLIGQGVNTMVLAPFGAIWSIVKFEIAAADGSEQVFGRLADLFATGLLIVLLVPSLYAAPIINVLAGPAYQGGAALVPVICMAYFFFSFSSFLSLPAELTSETSRLIPGCVAAAVTNVGANLILIPRVGVVGAAWATVLTFAILAAGNFVFCRGAGRIELPFGRVAVKLALSVAAVVFVHYAAAQSESTAVFWTLAGVVWLGLVGAFVASIEPRRLFRALQQGHPDAPEVMADA